MAYCGRRWRTVDVGGVLWTEAAYCGRRWRTVDGGGVLWTEAAYCGRTKHEWDTLYLCSIYMYMALDLGAYHQLSVVLHKCSSHVDIPQNGRIVYSLSLS